MSWEQPEFVVLGCWAVCEMFRLEFEADAGEEAVSITLQVS